MKTSQGWRKPASSTRLPNFRLWSAGSRQEEKESQWVLPPPLHGFFKASLLRFDSTDSTDVNSSWEEIKLQPSVSIKRNVTHTSCLPSYISYISGPFLPLPPPSFSTCVKRLWKHLTTRLKHLPKGRKKKCLTASSLHNVNLSPVCSHPYPHIYQPALVCLCCFVFLFFSSSLPTLICRAFRCDELRGSNESPSGGRFPFLLNHWTHVSPVWSPLLFCFFSTPGHTTQEWSRNAQWAHE